MESFIYCNKCGTLIPDGKDTCPKCGAKINGDPEETLKEVMESVFKEDDTPESGIDITMVTPAIDEMPSAPVPVMEPPHMEEEDDEEIDPIEDLHSDTNTLRLPKFATSQTQPIPIIRDTAPASAHTATLAFGGLNVDDSIELPKMNGDADPDPSLDLFMPGSLGNNFIEDSAELPVSSRPVPKASEMPLFDVPSTVEKTPEDEETKTEELSEAEITSITAVSAVQAADKAARVSSAPAKPEPEDDDDDEEDDGPNRTPLMIAIVLILLALIFAAFFFLDPFGLRKPKPAEEPQPTETPTVEPTAEPTAEPEPQPIGHIVITISELNIRGEASTDGKIVGLATYGDEYDVYETAEGGGYTWYRIGDDQWVVSNYANYTEAQPGE